MTYVLVLIIGFLIGHAERRRLRRQCQHYRNLIEAGTEWGCQPETIADELRSEGWNQVHPGGERAGMN